MITRILTSRLPLMIYNPVKIFDTAYFESIADAGALPVFDTEFLSDDDIVEKAGQLSRHPFLFGIRLDRPDPELINRIKNSQFANLDALIVPFGSQDKPFDSGGFNDTRIVLEIREVDLSDQVCQIDPHALVLRGNEAGGWVSGYSSFILMQWYLKHTRYPVFIHGGVGRYTAAGLFAAGVSGLVLDSQVLLTNEAPVSPRFKKLMETVEEGDSTEISFNGSTIYRVFAKLGTKVVKDLKQQAVLLLDDPQGSRKLYRMISEKITACNREDVEYVQSLFYLGQDGLFAKDFVKKTGSLSRVVSDLFTDTGVFLDTVDRYDPVAEGSAFAKDQGTRYPLIQGPMANISDKAAFAAKVLDEGALPFFAVGSLPAPLADDMLAAGTREVDLCGAGLVGIEAFNPFVRQHMDMVKKYKVPYALFAGGVPSQVAELEAAGIKTYLHTPSVPMMHNALESGCKRFIFEGGEAGGHVGSLSSLVLWEAAVSKLMDTRTDLSDLYLVFAGGISTCYASFFMSGMTSILAQKGARIGLQVGTAYLFSKEIVDTSSLTSQYQEIIIEKNKTVVVGKTVGLASRTAPTQFARMMLKTEQDMIKKKLKLEERKRAFEKKNIGSLLIGAKGFLPDFDNPGPEHYRYFNDVDHREKGNFLVGDSLAFFTDVVTVQDIHTRYFKGKRTLVRNLNQLEVITSPQNQVNDEIAVIGMGCTLPDAGNPEELWENILNRKYSIRPMPQKRFNRSLYYDPDRTAEDKSYTDLAGFVEDYEFDAQRFGYMDGKDKRLSRSQQMVLETAYKAVADAGYLGDDDRLTCDDPGRTAVIIATCLGNELGNELQLKYYFPELVSMMETIPEYQALTDDEKAALKASLQSGLEENNPGYDPVHGILLNIEASRIARHLGIRGTNYIVDAACASSFTALDAAAGELLSGEYDQVIVGGVNTHLAPESFIGFAKMGTLSAKGSFPFDERADGFILGEGAVIFMLKRMKDAIRDKDRILGVINSIGSSSDGRGKAIAAPNPAGQKICVKRCFENLKKPVSPSDIGFIEAHGTSTTIGDKAELETLVQTYNGSRAGISSIKSQIGHLLGCAGSAGLIKAVLAVNKGVLPPNGGFEALSGNHDMTGSGLYIIKDPAPWESPAGISRKAGISSYGFGGINYHMILEQMTESYEPVPRKIFSDTGYDFNDDRIVIAGLGVFLPGADNCDRFWEKLQSGEKQLSSIPKEHFDNDAYAAMDPKSFYYLPKVKAGVVKDYKFDNLKYRMPPKMVRSIERGQLFGLEAAGEAIQSSGLDALLESGNRIGVILGTIAGERQSKNIVRVRKHHVAGMLRQCHDIEPEKADAVAGALVDIIRERIPENNEDTTPGLLSNLISGRIANYFGLNGANYVIDASCASATIAIRNAARNLKFKDLDFVLAGGVDTNLYPAVLMAFKRLGLLSPTECHFFDSRANGYVMGEGAAIHVMTTHANAKKAGMTILAELNGCHIESSVPDHLLAPSEQTFVSTIDHCYEQTGLRKKDIDYLDLFAFSNVFGDMVEKQVIEACFDHPLYCGNIKPQFGYFKAANPAVALAKLALMNSKGRILPTFNYSADHTTMDDKSILKSTQTQINKPLDQPLRFAANVNGIGGNHGHLVLSTLPVSLKQEAVDTKTAVTADDTVDIVPALRDYSYSADNSGQKLRIVALLSGQGAQHGGMMKGLYQSDTQIRRVMDRGDAIFKEQRGYSLLDMMFGNDSRLDSTQNTQPAIFLSSAAICSRLCREGFRPDYYIGHSVGEYTALFCSGMLGFDDAMKLVIKRSDLMYEATLNEPGRIMVVFKNEKETEALIRKSYVSDIYVTNKNSEKQTAVSGKADAIETFCEFLTQQDVFHKKLNLTGAFHTPLLAQAAEKLRAFLDTLRFNDTRFDKIISNTQARPYPEDPSEVKDLLARQIVSPVEFIRSVEYVYVSGRTHFIEIGPSRLLVNLLKNINIGDFGTAVSVDPGKGEVISFNACRQYLMSLNALFSQEPGPAPGLKQVSSLSSGPPETGQDPVTSIDVGDDFEAFKEKNQALMDKILYKEYLRQKREAAIEAVERYDFNTGKILISGVSVGLPGKGRRVFAKDNFHAILNGENFIEPLTVEDQMRITDKNITKLYKQPDGNARFIQITRLEDVIHLAGQLGYFNLTDEYGIKEQYDVSMALGIAAGIEALKDANIPLVMQYKKVRDGRGVIPDGFALPEEMQEETGVIITSLWPNGETLISELEKYFYEKLFLKPYEAFENIYYYLMEKVKDVEIKDQLTEWFFKVKSGKRSDIESYKFQRDFLSNACPLGSAHLAQIIKAKGPNTLVSSACASTTLAIGIAEDWIRVGRCKRVLVVGGENATSPMQNQWVGSGFLALGAATVKKRVSEAAKPFDEDRNGTILGSGAVGLVIEDEACVRARGMKGQCEILGTHIANSAYHTYNIDVPHMSREMKKFIDKVEKQNSIVKEEYADKLLFMSHETYTPARGGSADAEVTALEAAFSDYLNRICISNTKGFTGHTLGAAIEDVVLVKALQYRKAPPIANLKKIPAHFSKLSFSGQEKIDAEYGFHLAAGFGSHFAFLFVKRIQENTVENNAAYNAWLQHVTGSARPELKIIDNTLCAVADPMDSKKAAAPPVPASPMPAAPAVPEEKPAMMPAPAAAETKTVAPAAAEASMDAGQDKGVPVDVIKDIIAVQTGYTVDMLDEDLDLEADLGIDTVKQVEIFGKIASHFGFSVPDDLKLRDLNTIERLSTYIADRIQVAEKLVTGPLVPPEPAIAPAPEPAATVLPEASSKESVVKGVREVIAEQTGYTVDMLDEDLDLEADLGIDTVKQVEIFGKISSSFGFSVPDDLKLRELNTIARLTDYIMNRISTASAPAAPQPSAATPSAAALADDLPADGKDAVRQESSGLEPGDDGLPDPDAPVKRLVVRTKTLDMPAVEQHDLSGRTVLVTLDSHGFSDRIIDIIKAGNGKVITLGGADADVTMDLTDISLLEDQVAALGRQHPEVNCLIHLAPLDHYFGSQDSQLFDHALNASLKSLFIMIKGLYDQLDGPDSFIGTLSFDSVVFPYMEDCNPVYPLFAGMAGLLKTVNKELARTRVKIVDFSYKQPKSSIKRIARVFMDELLGDDPLCEVGYRSKKRYGLKMFPQPADSSGQVVKPGDTLLVTGGFGGITHEIVKQVVKDCQANLVLLDINDIDGMDQRYLDKSAGQPELMALLKQDMPGVKPVEIKQALDRVMRARQAVDHMDSLKAMGVQVDYHCVDVTDQGAVQEVVDRYDRIDGILHAAGMEMSQFIPKKELASFEKVVDVKVKGMVNLLVALENMDYRYFITFSSVTARFGNEGQVDYTAANDFLGKALFREKQLHPDRIYKVYAWTAWSGAGMATNPTVKKVLEDRGLQFLPMDLGIRFFMADLKDETESEMVFSGIDYSFDKDGLLGKPLQQSFPFLNSIVRQTGGHVLYKRVLDIAHDRFLLDHAMEDTPVFLGATGIETMAEAAMSLAGDEKRLVEVSDFSIPYGIKLLKKRPKEILVSASKSDGRYHCEITSIFKNAAGVVMGEPKLHYQGVYTFSDKPLPVEKRQVPSFSPLPDSEKLVELIYHPQRLFMDGVFRTIRRILSFDGKTLVTQICDRSEEPFFTADPHPQFITNVNLLDGMFQTGGVYQFLTDSTVVLPLSIKQMTLYEKGEKHFDYLCITTRTASDDDTDTFQIDLVKPDGRYLVSLEDFKMVKLNRLSNEHRISHYFKAPNGVEV